MPRSGALCVSGVAEAVLSGHGHSYKRPVAAFGAFTSYQAREWFKEYKSSLGPSTPNQEAYIKLLDAVMLVCTFLRRLLC
eukprot:scaffold207_cov409-Prasinococcus_capsulatus_cf.AAC.135